MSAKPSIVKKRSVVIAGHKTSVSLEDAFWLRLKAFASEKDQTISMYLAALDLDRDNPNFSSTLRLHVVEQLSAQLNELRSKPAE